MIRTRRRAVIILVTAMAMTLVATVVRTSATEAAWEGRDHVRADVTTGYWPTNGSAYARSGSVVRADSLSLLAGGTPLPWPGPTASRERSNPGASLASTAGPFSTGSVLGAVIQLFSTGVSGGPISGPVCAAYGWGPGSPTICPGSAEKVFASATLSSYRLRASVIIGLASANAIEVPTARTLTATATCALTSDTPVYSATAANAGTGGGGYGTITIGGNQVNIPPPGGTSNDPVGGSVEATVRSSRTTVGGARSTLSVDGTISLLGLGLIGFEVVLVDAACGPGSSSAPASSTARARVAAPTTAASTTAASTTAASTTAASTTATPPTTTSTATPPTTTSTATPPTTTSTATPPTPTTTTEPTTTTATTEPTTTAAPTTTATTTTTTEPTEPTRFSGPVDGVVTGLTTADGVTCTSDGAGTFSCDDATTLTFSPMDLTSEGVRAGTVDGVWSPRTTSGAVIEVGSATRT